MNSNRTPEISTLLRNKLAKLTLRLQSSASPDNKALSFDTLESVVAEATSLLSRFYRSLSAQNFDPKNFLAYTDSFPELDLFKSNFLEIQDDLKVIFAEFENLEGVILGEFNYAVSKTNRLQERLREVSSRLGDFILYSRAPTKDAIYFGDSFNNLSMIEANSPLLSVEQCTVNQVEGTVLLPVDKNAQVAINVSEVPVINSSSNGSVGNSLEANAEFHGTLSDVLDNNADTWFEYERTLDENDNVSLVLDFTINLGDAKVINAIRINPNNFGAKLQVKIEAIDTSLDGKIFTSIKDDIPIVGYLTEDEENVFTLASSSSKYSGQGFYTFTPRKTKFVRISLKQDSVYSIETTAGTQKLRYAIGIRDIELLAQPYKTEGEIISKEFKSPDEIRKVALLSAQSPIAESVSKLASITHWVSANNGVSWNEIRPKASAGVANAAQVVPEILDYNGVSDGTIKTQSAVGSLRYKAVLKRNTSAFVPGNEEFAEVKVATTELHSLPTTTPFNLALQQTPIAESIVLVDPLFGSRGREESKYEVALGSGNPINVLTQFKNIPRVPEKYTYADNSYLRQVSPIKVYINGNEWTEGLYSGSTATDKVYSFSHETGRLRTGDGVNGMAVPNGASVSIILDREQIFPGIEDVHETFLEYPTANDKKRISIYTEHPLEEKTVILKKGQTRHVLDKWILGTNTGEYAMTVTGPTLSNSYYREFEDGSSEFLENITAGRQWSVDAENGILYTYSRVSSSVDSSIHYFYNKRTYLKENEWDFVVGNGLSNKLQIKNSAYIAFLAPTMDVPSEVKYFNLAHLGVVKNTISFLSNETTPASLAKEVEFVDGKSELLGMIETRQQVDAFTSTVSLRTIDLKLKVTEDTDFAVSFSKQNIFATSKSSKDDCLAVGDYYVDRTNSIVYVYSTENHVDPGHITYFYADPRVNLTGVYSVNYKTGEVFTYTATGSGITANYNITSCYAEYDIARLVSSSDWTVDLESNTISVEDREILKNIRTPQRTVQTGIGIGRFYQVSYDYIGEARSNISELEPFFSPVLKDYALKVVTKGRLV